MVDEDDIEKRAAQAYGEGERLFTAGQPETRVEVCTLLGMPGL